MEVKFNGKKITISQVGTEIFSSMLDNAAKNINKYGNELAMVFSEAYRVVLVSRLGKKSEQGFSGAGIGTGLLKNSINVKKQSVSFIRRGKTSGLISISHVQEFSSRNEAALAIGHDGSFNNKVPSTDKLENWIRTKKNNSFKYDSEWYNKVKNKERALARLIIFRWKNGGRKHVLPKWYDVFKDGDKEALSALYKNKAKLENSIKKILNG